MGNVCEIHLKNGRCITVDSASVDYKRRCFYGFTEYDKTIKDLKLHPIEPGIFPFENALYIVELVGKITERCEGEENE